MRSVFLAIPSHSGELKPATSLSVQLIELECAGLGYTLQTFIWAGDSIVSHARNVCVGQFLTTDCTDLFFLDDDVSFGPGVFTKLLHQPVDFVAGVYRTKAETERYPVLLKTTTPDERGLLEALGVPFGCARLRRSVIDRLVAADPDAWFYGHCTDQLRCWPLFHVEYRDRHVLGEDFYFCRQWRALGGQVWVDPELRLLHVGRTMFEGHYGDYLRRTA